MEFDEETLSIMRSYCGGDPRVRQRVTRTALSEYGGETWSLQEFQGLIAAAIESIPLGCRESAKVELEGGYEESTELKIEYEDWQTDEEVAERVARAYAYAHERQMGERATFERLKAKFTQ